MRRKGPNSEQGWLESKPRWAAKLPCQPIPEAAQMIIKLVALTIIGIMFVVVPTLFMLFFQSRHAKATEHELAEVLPGAVGHTLTPLRLSMTLARLALLLLLLGGCASFEQESDWRWKQQNPDYQAPWPQEKANRPVQF